MSERMVGWVSVKKVMEADGDRVEVLLSVGSFEGQLALSVGAGDWSRMLSTPNLPVQAQVRFEPKL